MLWTMKTATLRTLLALPLLASPAALAEAPRLENHEVAFDLQSRGDDEPRPPTPFGLAGHTRLTIGTGVAFALEESDDSTDYNLNLAWSRFIVDDWEFRVELGGWYFDQEPDSTWGVNPGIAVRWHFINEGPWTVYGDAGIGLLVAADDVPSGGSSIDFMPRVGGGITRRINARGDRLEFGVRWHHVSNARVVGDSNNPDRDGVMLYAGISFPL
jgi:hypothetical protein